MRPDISFPEDHLVVRDQKNLQQISALKSPGFKIPQSFHCSFPMFWETFSGPMFCKKEGAISSTQFLDSVSQPNFDFSASFPCPGRRDLYFSTRFLFLGTISISRRKYTTNSTTGVTQTSGLLSSLHWISQSDRASKPETSRPDRPKSERPASDSPSPEGLLSGRLVTEVNLRSDPLSRSQSTSQSASQSVSDPTRGIHQEMTRRSRYLKYYLI